MELSIAGLSKQYKGNVWGLKEFSLTLGPGILGLLGPNGAGKSTLMRMLATVTKPTEGAIRWNGEDVAAHPDNLRRTLGYLPQDFGVYPHLTAKEFLQYLAAAKGMSGTAATQRLDELLQLVNLFAARNRPVGGFSGGMRQRVGIAAALLNDPKLLIVDEPTAGLDPEERVRFRNLLADLSGERIVILSTHIVSDVEATASSIAMIAGGRLLVHASADDLLARLAGLVWEVDLSGDQLVTFKERHLVTGVSRRADGMRVRVVMESATHASARAVAPTLEDVYLWHVTTGRERVPA